MENRVKDLEERVDLLEKGVIEQHEMMGNTIDLLEKIIEVIENIEKYLTKKK